MKFLALACLLVGTLIAAQASAHDIATQPLTRAECDEAALVWDENGNVCSANSKAAEFQTDLKPAADVSSQPLTRHGCDKASMTRGMRRPMYANLHPRRLLQASR